MVPVDIIGALKAGLAKDRRPSDGLLHCSSDILGSLRHSQLALAGAPTIENELVQDVRLKTGTMWHDLLRDYFVQQGLAVMGEVRLGVYLPEGWQGTADWLFWDFNKRCFVLGDLKTTKGEGMFYIEKEGAKAEHIAQLSAYYHALVDSGMPVRKGFFICYLPMNTDSDKRLAKVEPTLVDCVPMDKELLHAKMSDRWEAARLYLDDRNDDGLTVEQRKALTSQGLVDYDLSQIYVEQTHLASPIDREQKWFFDKKLDKWELKLVPNWRTKFCPYVDELCTCSDQGTTKLGEFKDEYVPRKGFEHVEPESLPRTAKRLEVA